MSALTTLQFHHFGLAVPSDRDALPFLSALGFCCGDPVYDPLQKVNVRMCELPGHPAVELIWPAGPDGPLTRLLKRGEPTIYHTCYEVDAIASTIAELESGGLRVLEISGPKPAILFGGRRVAFYMIVGYGLIELLERTAP